jgi:hypothetical protein
MKWMIVKIDLVVSLDPGSAAFVWLPTYVCYVEREALIFHYSVLPFDSSSGSDVSILHHMVEPLFFFS